MDSIQAAPGLNCHRRAMEEEDTGFNHRYARWHNSSKPSAFQIFGVVDIATIKYNRGGKALRLSHRNLDCGTASTLLRLQVHLHSSALLRGVAQQQIVA